VVVLNFTPVARAGYRIGLPQAGRYAEIFNSDSAHYGGSNQGNGGGVQAQMLPWMGLSFSAAITLPPLAGIILTPEPSR
jgi:1,4-alpha-glucan branching enzyme